MKKLLEHKEELVLYVLTYIGGITLIIGGVAAVCGVYSTIFKVLGID